MGLKDKLKETKTRMMIGALVKMLSSYLTNLLAGVPLDREDGEAEAVIMMSPGKRDTDIYIVVLSEDRKIARVCKKIAGKDLGDLFLGKMKEAGVDLEDIAQVPMPEEPLNEEEL